MTGDDERDYDEEADVRADVVREGLAEMAAERAALVDGHMTGPAHYREAERLAHHVRGILDTMQDRGELPPDLMHGLCAQLDNLVGLGQVHATLAAAAATALGVFALPDAPAEWERVLG